tara:strand:+ start:1452 stop:1694 length:243 start_codon:yes stop_codon:yes gene_type:complete
MKKTLFIETESGTVVVPRLENSSWLGRWAFDRWLKKYFKATVQKATIKNWRILSTMFEVKSLTEEDEVYRVETTCKNVRG